MDSESSKDLGEPGGQNEGALPPIGETVWVQCEGFRTLAYRDDKGRWRTVADGRELKGVVKVASGEY